MVVSFVVVAYNAEKSIGSLFQCLQQQTYPKELIDVILVDSNSKDRTKAIMEDFAANAHFRSIAVLDNHSSQRVGQPCSTSERGTHHAGHLR